MSKKQKKQYNNNNKRNSSQYNNQNNGNDGRYQQQRQPRVNPNELKVRLCLPADLNEAVKNEILDVLASMPFNKVSVPLGTYRSLLDYSVPETDTRISTIGYMRKYDPETCEFTVIVFSNFIDTIKDLGDIALELLYTTNKAADALGAITKFNIVPVVFKDDDCNSESLED